VNKLRLGGGTKRVTVTVPRVPVESPVTWAAGPHTKEGAARAGACKRRRLQAPRGSASDMDAPPRDDKAGCEDDAAPLPPPPTPREDQEEEKRPLRRVDASGMGMLICRQQGPGADDGLITTIAVVDPGGAAHASGNFAAGDVLYNVASDACASMSEEATCFRLLARVRRACRPRRTLARRCYRATQVPLSHRAPVHGRSHTLRKDERTSWHQGAPAHSSRRLSAQTASVFEPGNRFDEARVSLSRLDTAMRAQRDGVLLTLSSCEPFRLSPCHGAIHPRSSPRT